MAEESGGKQMGNGTKGKTSTFVWDGPSQYIESN